MALLVIDTILRGASAQDLIRLLELFPITNRRQSLDELKGSKNVGSLALGEARKYKDIVAKPLRRNDEPA